ncbi:MAG TPA: hypothetical protein VII42_15975 [Caulobacteraceae bacterium]
MRNVALCALIGFACAGAAQANPTQDAATRFGLPGTWALNCAKPPAPDNEYAHWTLAPGGKISQAYDDGPTDLKNRYRWDTARLLGSDTIVLDGVFFGNGLGQHVEILKRDGRIRPQNSSDSSGRKLVVDGAFPSGGGPSWFTRCGSGR